MTLAAKDPMSLSRRTNGCDDDSLAAYRMTRRRPRFRDCAVALAAGTCVAAVASAASPAEPVRLTAHSCRRLPPLRSRAPHSFFPSSLTGLAAQRTPAGVAYGCIYMIGPRRLDRIAIWRPPTGGRLRGPTWSPAGHSFAIAQTVDKTSIVFKVDLHGRVTLRAPAVDFAFLRDGRLVVRRNHALLLEKRPAHFSLLASERDLEHAAGFRPGFYGGMWATRGSSEEGIVVQWWAPAGDFGNVLLLIDARGHVRPVTPRWRRAGTYMPGPAAWSPDGRTLMIPWQRQPVTGPADHVHCLGLWSRGRGYRTAFCKNPHFNAIAWSPDGAKALLNNGRTVSETGRVLGPPRRLGPAFAIQWSNGQ